MRSGAWSYLQRLASVTLVCWMAGGLVSCGDVRIADTPEATMQRYLALLDARNVQGARQLFDWDFLLSQTVGPSWATWSPQQRQLALALLWKELAQSSVFKLSSTAPHAITRQSFHKDRATVRVQSAAVPHDPSLFDLWQTAHGWRIWNVRNDRLGLDLVQLCRRIAAESQASLTVRPPSPFAEQTEALADLQTMYHQPVVIAELSDQFAFVGYLEGVSQPASVVARLRGLFPQTTMPAPLWRDATRTPGARVIASSTTQHNPSQLLLVDALVNGPDLAFAKYDGESSLIPPEQLEAVRQIPFSAIAVKLLIQRQPDGQWGFVLPDDVRAFERKAAELGL